jgi:hypothetical protein
VRGGSQPHQLRCRQDRRGAAAQGLGHRSQRHRRGQLVGDGRRDVDAQGGRARAHLREQAAPASAGRALDQHHAAPAGGQPAETAGQRHQVAGAAPQTRCAVSRRRARRRHRGGVTSLAVRVHSSARARLERGDRGTSYTERPMRVVRPAAATVSW